MKEAVQQQCPLTCGVCSNDEPDDQPGNDGDDNDDDESDATGGSSDGPEDSEVTDDKEESDDSDDSDDSGGKGEACVCKASWSDADTEGCETKQSYCPEKACDGDTDHWCLV